jgi:hypothetical protein
MHQGCDPDVILELIAFKIKGNENERKQQRAINTADAWGHFQSIILASTNTWSQSLRNSSS